MTETPLLDYQGRRAEAARNAVRHQSADAAPPARRYAEARAMVREALTFPDALETVWSQLIADAEADLITDFAARGQWLRDFFDRIIGAMAEGLEWARREGKSLERDIPRVGELAAAVLEAEQLRDRALANWPDPDRDFGDAPPTLGALDVSEGAAYLGPDEFSARLRGGRACNPTRYIRCWRTVWHDWPRPPRSSSAWSDTSGRWPPATSRRRCSATRWTLVIFVMSTTSPRAAFGTPSNSGSTTNPNREFGASPRRLIALNRSDNASLPGKWLPPAIPGGTLSAERPA